MFKNYDLHISLDTRLCAEGQLNFFARFCAPDNNKKVLQQESQGICP
jgi:hypothetical protein